MDAGAGACHGNQCGRDGGEPGVGSGVGAAAGQRDAADFQHTLELGVQVVERRVARQQGGVDGRVVGAPGGELGGGFVAAAQPVALLADDGENLGVGECAGVLGMTPFTPVM